MCHCLGRIRKGINLIEDGLEFPFGSPFQRRLYINTVAAVTADQALLFYEEGPDVEA